MKSTIIFFPFISFVILTWVGVAVLTLLALNLAMIQAVRLTTFATQIYADRKSIKRIFSVGILGRDCVGTRASVLDRFGEHVSAE